MFVENSASIYLQRMHDRSMRSGTKFAREIQLTDWSTAGNLSNWSSGVQLPRDICTRFGCYLYSTRCSWIINAHIQCNTKWITGDMKQISETTSVKSLDMILKFELHKGKWPFCKGLNTTHVM